MANKKVSQLTSKPSVLVTDLFPIADPSTGQLYKTTISDLGTAIGSGVSSVNGLVGAVVLDTDDIQELVSPTNKWFTDTRARAALSASSPLAYNSGTGVFSIPAATSSQNGYLTSTDWTTFNSKQQALSGTGFVKISGTTISYDNTSYLPLTGGTLTGTLIGTRAEFITSTLVDGILVNNGSGRGIRIVNGGSGYGLIINNETASSAVPFVIQKSGLDKIYFTDSGAGNFTSSLTASSFVKSGGTSSQYLMADGSVSTLTNPVTGTGTSGIVAKFNGTSSVTDSIIYDNGTRVSIGADVTTSNKFTAVASTTSSYAVVAQASGAANGFWATLSGTGEIFRGQTSGGSYFIINNGGNAFLNGNLNVGDFASTSYKLNVVGTGNFTGALSGTSATFSGAVVVASPFTIKDTNPYIQWKNASDTRLGYIQHATNLVMAADTGSINLNTSGGSLVIASTGAATFSSSVNINSASGASGAQGFLFFNYAPSNSSSRSWKISNDQNVFGDLAIQYSATQTGAIANTAVQILNNGNVGIGTTSPDAQMHLNNSSGDSRLYISSSTGSGSYIRLLNNGTQKWFIGTNATGSDNDYNIYGYSGQNGNIISYTNGSERMRITSAGNVGIGTTAPQGGGGSTDRTLSVNSGAGAASFVTGLVGDVKYSTLFTSSSQFTIETNASIPITFNTNSTERMRITSDGNLLLGTTGNASGVRAYFYSNSTTSSSYPFATRNSAGTDTMYIRSDGYGYLLASAWAYGSDLRLKENVEYIGEGMSIISKLKPAKFDYINGVKSNIGWIAQDVQKVIPEAVSINSMDENNYLALKQEFIVPYLVKAVQELKAELDTLKNK